MDGTEIKQTYKTGDRVKTRHTLGKFRGVVIQSYWHLDGETGQSPHMRHVVRWDDSKYTEDLWEGEITFDKKEIGFISGCFDGFHDGHKFILKECLKNCDELWIGINSDDYIRRNKKREPINNVRERIGAISEYFNSHKLDWFVICFFDGDSPLSLIEAIKPDIIFCGDDYTKEQVVGHELAEVMLIKRIPGISTTELLKK